MLELGVQAGALGAEVGDAERGGDAGARQDDDVLGRLEQLDGVVDRVVLGQLGALGQLAAEGQAKQRVVGLVVGALEEGGRADAKGGEQLPGRDEPGADGPLAEDGGADGAQQLAELGGLLGGAGVGVCGGSAWCSLNGEKKPQRQQRNSPSVKTRSSARSSKASWNRDSVSHDSLRSLTRSSSSFMPELATWVWGSSTSSVIST